MASERCALCGRDPAAGFATINGERYCHGDEDLREPTCYIAVERRLVEMHEPRFKYRAL